MLRRFESQTWRWLPRFRRDERGNVASIFAIVIVPVIALVGGAVDYGRAILGKSNLQAATDGSLLATAKLVRNGTPVAEVGQAMLTYIRTVSGDPNARLAEGFPTLSADKSTFCVDALTESPTAFMRLGGYSEGITLRSHACAKFNLDTFEIALVVDNSGSMNNSALNGQTKIQAARLAAKDLVTVMTPPTGSPIPVPAFSVVPFAAAVNIGAANAGKPFMDTSGRSSIHWENFKRPAGAPWLPTTKFDLFSGIGVAWGGCAEERPAPYTTSDDPANAAVSYDTLYVPYLYPDENDASSYSLNDYLSDGGGSCRTGDLYAQADAATTLRDGQSKVCKYNGGRRATGSSGFGSAFPLGPNLLCSTNALTPLTTNLTDVNAAIDAMRPLGDTNLLSGTMWGWRTISPNGPFNAGARNVANATQAAKSYSYANPDGSPNHKVLVLLTDGDNHWGGQASDGSGYSRNNNKSAYSAVGFFWQNRLGGTANPTAASNAYEQMNAATLQACTSAKAAGIEIYTVALTASDAISTTGQALLKNCSSGTGHFFVASNGNELRETFKKIADQLSILRLTQ